VSWKFVPSCASVWAMPIRRDVPEPEGFADYMRHLASKGGKRGGRSRWKGVTPEERSRQMRAVRAGKKKRP